MGDRRFESPYERVRLASDRAFAISLLSDDEVVSALAAAARHSDPLLANVLATEAMNRVSRARAIVRNVADGIIAVDAEGVVSLANPAAESILGWRAAELRGHDAHDMLHYEAPDGTPLPREGCPVQRCLSEGVVLQGAREWLVARDGTHVHVDLSIAPILRDGDVAGAVITLRPVPEQPRAARAAGAPAWPRSHKARA